MKIALKQNKSLFLVFTFIFLLVSGATSVSATELGLFNLLQKVQSKKLSAVGALGKITDMYLSGTNVAPNFDSLVAEYISFGRIKTLKSKMLPTPDKDGYLLRKNKPMTASEMHQFLKLFSAAAVSGSKLSEKIGLNINDKTVHPANVQYHIKSCSILSNVAKTIESKRSFSFSKLVRLSGKHLNYNDFDTNKFINHITSLDSKVGDKYKLHMQKAAKKFQAASVQYREKMDFLKGLTKQISSDKLELSYIKDIESYLTSNKSALADPDVADAIDKLKNAFETSEGITHAIDNAHAEVKLHKENQTSYLCKMFSRFISIADFVFNFSGPQNYLRTFLDVFKENDYGIPSGLVEKFLHDWVEASVTVRNKSSKEYKECKELYYQIINASYAATARLRVDILHKKLPELSKAKKVEWHQIKNVLLGLSDYVENARDENDDETPQTKKINDLANILSYYLERYRYAIHPWYEAWFKLELPEVKQHMKKIMIFLRMANTLTKKVQMLDNKNELRPISELSKKELASLEKSLEVAIKIFFVPFIAQYNSKKQQLEQEVANVLDGGKIERYPLTKLIKNFEYHAVGKEIFNNLDAFIDSFNKSTFPRSGITNFDSMTHKLYEILRTLGSFYLTAKETKEHVNLREFFTKLRDDKDKTATSIYTLLEDISKKFGKFSKHTKIDFDDLGFVDSKLSTKTSELYKLVKEGFEKSDYTGVKHDKEPFRGNNYIQNYEFNKLSGNKALDLNSNFIIRDLLFIMFLLDYNLEKMEKILSKIKNYDKSDYRKVFEHPLRKLMTKYSHDRNPENALVTKQINLSVDFLKELLKIN